MAISPQRLTIYLYSARRAVIFAIAQLSCQHCVTCVDLPYISSLGAFVHALLSRAFLSISWAFLLTIAGHTLCKRDRRCTLLTTP